MPQMRSVRLFAAAALFAFVRGQITSTDPNGNTVIVSISTDLVGGTTPIIVSTVAPNPAVPPATTTPVATQPAQTTTQATAPTTTPRVVGQPAPTVGSAEPTIYTYTTVDGNGNTQTFTDTYTPTYDVTTVPFSAPAGTIIPYDQYTSIYGGSTGGNQLNGAGRLWVGGGALIGAVAGLALVF
ncbi:unnamed protein product [Rhizoctonia solani]|uniref:Uncharacterized protein n=1 Tax=Rhizoctonia solani TaxID=456999 RepID=A0A8H3BQG8_9AGAM|nr:unnamed protein product [Rhizoctonia solani]